MVFTRKDYMSNKCSHREYYSQLVTPEIRAGVWGALYGRIVASKDPSFNDIALSQWDHLGMFLVPREPFKNFGDFYTKAGAVCVLKEAAQQIREAA